MVWGYFYKWLFPIVQFLSSFADYSGYAYVVTGNWNIRYESLTSTFSMILLLFRIKINVCLCCPFVENDSWKMCSTSHRFQQSEESTREPMDAYSWWKVGGKLDSCKSIMYHIIYVKYIIHPKQISISSWILVGFRIQHDRVPFVIYNYLCEL